MLGGTLQILEHLEPEMVAPQVAQNWLGSQPQSLTWQDEGDDTEALACEGTSGDMPHLCVAADHIQLGSAGAR